MHAVTQEQLFSRTNLLVTLGCSTMPSPSPDVTGEGGHEFIKVLILICITNYQLVYRTFLFPLHLTNCQKVCKVFLQLPIIDVYSILILLHLTTDT